MNRKLFATTMLGTLLPNTISHVAVNAQTPQSAAVVSGQVFDSLAGKTISKAFVWVVGSNRSTHADESGKFEMRDVPPGRHFIAFSSPRTDSLGFATLGAEVNVVAGGAIQVALATPSLSTVWRTGCGSTKATTGAGIVWGTVQDAANSVRLAGARTTVEWSEIDAKGTNIVRSIRNQMSNTDSAGTYFVCGIPAGSNFQLQAQGAKSSSGITEQVMPLSRVIRVDLSVSTEMYAGAGKPDSLQLKAGPLATGTAAIRGRVVDSDGRPVPDAGVMSVTTATIVRTDADGRFSFSNVPAGSHTFEVHHSNGSPERATVALVPRSTVELSMRIERVTELAGVNDRDENDPARDRLDFEHRREAKSGYTLTESEIGVKDSITTVLRLLPNASVTRATGGRLWMIPTKGAVSSRCLPDVWVDGTTSSMAAISDMDPRRLRGVEWYPRPTSAPAEYRGPQSCAVLLLWTTEARWGAAR